MKEREALKLALEALEDYEPNEANKAITAIKEALAQPEQVCGFDVVLDESMPPNTFKLAQPEQEPVAWGNFKEDGTLVGLSQHPEDQANWAGRKPLYTTPPQRTWIGLTDEDDIDWEVTGNLKQLVEAVEAKLKEKNT